MRRTQKSRNLGCLALVALATGCMVRPVSAKPVPRKEKSTLPDTQAGATEGE